MRASTVFPFILAAFIIMATPVALRGQALSVDAGFAGSSSVGRYEAMTLTLSRPLAPDEGHLAVFVGSSDVTALLDVENAVVRYDPSWRPLPTGQQEVAVYLVSPQGEWQEVGRFPVLVRSAAGFEKAVLTPSITLNNKGQLAQEQFPEPTQKPDRQTYQDLSGQFNFRAEFVRPAWTVQTQANVVGVSYQNEALRFSEKGDEAPKVDLSSYLVQIQRGPAQVQAGHVSHGRHRLLANNVSSRGLTAGVQLAHRVDVSVAALNGTRVVGWSNPLGVNDLDHRVFSGTFGVEAVASRPGALRVEASFVDASVLPRNNVNQVSITDAETSRGAGVRVQGNLSGQRLRFEAGLAGSRHVNPNDPTLAQGADLVPVQETTRYAHYADVTLGVLQNLQLSPTWPVKLSVNYRREQVAPLYRSVPAFVRANVLQNAVGVQANLGAVQAQFSHNRSEDNLDEIPSILKTRTRQNNLNMSVPLGSVIRSASKLAALLPSLTYSYNQTHQFGDHLPENGGFSESHVPDQMSRVHNAAANWTVWRVQMGYRFGASFQDNRQPGREDNDFANRTHSLTLGLNLSSLLTLNVDLNLDEAENKAQQRLDRTQRLGVRMRLQPVKRLALSANVSPTITQDDAKTIRRTNANVNLEAAYSFGLGTGQRKLIQGQVFLRYARRTSSNRDLTFDLNNENRFWTVNSGINLRFF